MKKPTIKNKSGLKEVLLELALVCIVMITTVSLQSCDNRKNNSSGETDHNNNMNGVSTKTEDPKDVAEEHNDAKFNKDTEKEAQLMVDAADINLTEIKLGNLAQTKGTSKQIKDLGKMMATDHGKALEELKKLASSKNVTLPETVSDKGMDEYNKLDEKTGRDFDKKYAEMMVDGHKEAIKKFEKCEEDCTDSQVKNWATKTLPTLRNHLDHSMSCYDAFKNDKTMK
jgi:putative membrane protein